MVVDLSLGVYSLLVEVATETAFIIKEGICLAISNFQLEFGIKVIWNVGFNFGLIRLPLDEGFRVCA